MPIPTKKDDSDNATRVTVVPKEAAMSGKPGKYMSMENGTMAVRSPKSSIVMKRFCLVMMLEFGKGCKTRLIFFSSADMGF